MITLELKTVLIFLAACFTTLFILPRISRIARRVGLVDRPNERKVHRTPRPLVGGIGMAIAAAFSALLFIPSEGLRGYFLGLSFLLVVGIFDDFKEIGHRQKFVAQIIATAFLIYFSRINLHSFGDLLGLGNMDFSGSTLLVWAVTLFCIVGVINAINMIDGLDGLAGGISFLAFLAFAIHASLIGNHALMLLNLALAGSVLGFLKYNWSPSTLFMGDAGSLCLGFSLAFMAIALTQGEGGKASPVVPLLILAVPITDTVIVMIRRVIRGESPFKADKFHLHHIILRYGFSRVEVVKVILLLSTLLCLLSFLGPAYQLTDRNLFLIYLGYAVVNIASSAYILRAFRRGEHFNDSPMVLLERFMADRTVTMWFRLSRIARKVPRYPVQLDMVCELGNGGSSFRGTVLNISSDGFMASIADLDWGNEDMKVRIFFQFDSGERVLELVAEHLWLNERDDKFFHGFRFKNEDDRKIELAELLRQYVDTTGEVRLVN
jgi:UDP-GlcNAc:undecaprenyl-phosphate GlcNAc-1-phosphate transferase